MLLFVCNMYGQQRFLSNHPRLLFTGAEEAAVKQLIQNNQDVYKRQARPTSAATPYSREKIEGTRAGLNPYLYPNVEWYDEMFKKNAFAQLANVNIRGGNKKMDYFMSVGVKHSDGDVYKRQIIRWEETFWGNRNF